MRKILTAILVCLVAWMPALCAVHSVGDIPNGHVADRTKYVSNPDGVLSPATVALLNRQIAELWDSTTVELAVVAIDDYDADDIDDFATALFEAWGLGKRDKDNGVLMVVAKDRHDAVIRTGYGAEGPITDVVAGRILRRQMFPRFRQGDIDGGVIAGVAELCKVMTNPEYAEEMRSSYANDARPDSNDDEGLLETLGIYLAIMLLCSLIVLWYEYRIYRKGIENNLSTVDQYRRLQRLSTPLLMFVCIGLGVPLIAYLPLKKLKKLVRDHARSCPRCKAQMRKLDEVSDNAYLTAAQDLEEQLGSVDYDVWLCPDCNEVDVLPYENQGSVYTRCKKCGAKTESLVSDSVVQQPTTRREGMGLRVYQCRNCGARRQKRYSIARRADDAAVLGAVLGAAARGGGFGSGGISGGSFGGGRTGGGGASGHW